mgnify:CR=1 FL=1
MSKNTIKLISLCMIFILAVCSFGSIVSADGNINFSELFEGAVNSDGAYAEDASVSLLNAFDRDSISFVKAASELNEKELKTVSMFLVYAANYNDLDEFESIILELKNKNDFLESEEEVIEAILQRIEDAKSEGHNSKPISVELRKLKFSPYMILKYIENSDNNFDEEYIEVIGNAFRDDPEEFAKTIESLSDSEIQLISKYLAYDCIKKNKTDFNKSIINDDSKENHNKLIDMVRSEISNKDNKNMIENIRNANLKEEKTEKITPIPNIESIYVENKNLNVGEESILQVKLSEKTSVNTLRVYYTEIYAMRNNKEYFKTSGIISIPEGKTSAEGYFNQVFYSTEPTNILVKIYSSDTTSVIVEKESSYQIAAAGKWHIDVDLPVDRDYKGQLYLWDSSGTLKLMMECLGKSQSNEDMLEENGNTPTGEYTGSLDGPHLNTGSYGPYKYVKMTGVSGVIIDSGRSGIWIHGGNAITDTSNTHYPLRVTNGCVRIGNADQQRLQNMITSLISSGHDSKGTISIYE